MWEGILLNEEALCLAHKTKSDRPFLSNKDFKQLKELCCIAYPVERFTRMLEGARVTCSLYLPQWCPGF